MHRIVLLGILFAALLPLHSARAADSHSVAARSLDAADAAYRDSQWDTAASLYRDLAAENPDQGGFWYRLATSEYHLKRYDEAVDHYARAVSLGFFEGVSLYNSACCLALTGHTEAAIDDLDRAIQVGLPHREELIRTDADLNSIRDTAEFHERILPAVPGDISRAEGWRIDIAYLTKRFAETHYAPFRYISRADWDHETARILKAIPKMKDYEIAVALMQLVVRVNDGHSVVFPPTEGALAFHSLPVDFYDFKDGWFIRGATPDYAELVGKRVVRIGDLPVREAVARVSTVVPRDNSQGVRWLLPIPMRCVETLNALGVCPGLDAVDITVADTDGHETRVSVKPIPLAAFHDTRHGSVWVDMSNGASDPLPLWRQNSDKNYWFDFLEDSGILYVGFHSVRDQEDESLSDFSRRLFEFIDAHPVRALVVDVRVNNGGNNTLARPLANAIIASHDIDRKGHLFVITGRQTFSACQNFCNWLDRDSRAIFVGEPTGSSPNFVGEGNEIVLPYSGLVANASSRFWQDAFSDDYRTWIAPHLAAESTSEDYRANRDPAMDVIFEYLDARTASVGKR